MRSSYFLACAAVLVLLLQAAMEVTTVSGIAVANCDRQDLSTACKEAKETGNPDANCCAKLKVHEPCLCEYLKDPVVWKFVQTEKGHHLFEVCQVP
ncbi:hypothetical protein Taro_036783 [Colocasia esculenta]|uniref:Bifunctional inhibitor/plant lipid transfer protein/seed storage helical domain-containing protein n=1 Tax=Colocasia esculenta TaxID=4460 RepID=A0A843W9B9_COLES|nr:hypothetical protein [Colocasia esculenta]